eukprot:gene6811-385_t
MPRFTHGYWSIRGLAASTRMLLWACDQKDFVDIKYGSEGAPEWKDDKFSLGLDFPNLPYLIDEKTGVKLTQSMAILRYLAEELKPEFAQVYKAMAPYVEMLSQQAIDLRNALVQCCYRSKSQADVDAFKNEKLSSMLNGFEAWFAKEREGPFLFGGVHYIDFYFAEHLEQISLLFEDSLAKYPNLKNYLAAFLDLDEVKSFRDSSHYMARPINNPRAAFVNN